MHTRVIGIGNPLRGDDGIGPAVVEMLTHERLLPTVQVIDGGEAGLGLVGLMEDAARVVLVDAAEMGIEPGTFRIFNLDEVLVDGEVTGHSLHNAKAGTALQMAKALGCLPQEVVVVGVQPKEMGWGTDMSPEVSGVLPRVVVSVLEILESFQNNPVQEE